MVIEMEEVILLNLNRFWLMFLSQAGPSVEMIDLDSEFWGPVLDLLSVLTTSTVGVQILRKLVAGLKSNKSLRQFLKEKGNGGIPGDVSLLFRSNYFRIAESVNLEFRKLERLITSSLPGNGSLLQQLLKLQAEIYHNLQERFYRRGQG